MNGRVLLDTNILVYIYDSVIKQIYIEPRQEHLLTTIAQQARISKAEIISQAINLHLSKVIV